MRIERLYCWMRCSWLCGGSGATVFIIRVVGYVTIEDGSDRVFIQKQQSDISQDAACCIRN